MATATLSTDETLRLYAGTLENYYSAEADFIAKPTVQTVGSYHRALEHLHTLREEITRLERFSAAAQSDEIEKIAREITEKLPPA